jgi:glycogen debranching enzyme
VSSDPGAPSRGAALVRQLRRVIELAQPFADAPQPSRLVALHPGVPVGNWRDSEHGLGDGRIPYDVNAVLVPAALDALARLQASGLLDGFASRDEAARFGQARAMADTWRRAAPGLFAVTVPRARAIEAVRQYARALGVPDAAARATIGPAGVTFHALALDGDGRPVPVMNSDEGFALLFGRPDAGTLDAAADLLLRPFPAGLLTPAGMLVANAAFAPTSLQPQFGRTAYHGAVVWSWQQALFAAGLERQRRRRDLPAETRARLAAAERALWTAIDATARLRNSELWSWTCDDGTYRPAAFGAAAGDADESNAAQLWSTVYLGVARPPAAGAAR